MPDAPTPLPCPWCGVVPWVSHQDFADNPDAPDYWVECLNVRECAVLPTGPSEETQAKAIAAWNRRQG